MSLAETLNNVARVPLSSPKGFDAPGTTDYTAGTFTTVTTAPVASEDYRKIFEHDTGLPVPEGQDVVLERSTVQRIGKAELFDADGNRVDGAQRYWYKFKFVPRQVSADTISESIFALQKRFQDAPAFIKSTPKRRQSAACVNIADLQLGKTDRNGGTDRTVEEFYKGIELAKRYVEQSGADTVALSELGDGIENFQNVSTQAQTNDRSLIEQLDLHGELLTYATVELSKLTNRLIVIGVPSNHMEVRENGKAVGGVHNDYGLLSLSNVKRALSLNTAAFGHVEFAWPGDHEVSLTVDLAGMPVGYAHGHYTKGNADGVEKWLTGQFAGNHPLQPARIINTAHFHHLRMQNIIGGRWWFAHPTLDRGSSWLEHGNGVGNSQNGLLCYQVNSERWFNMQLLQTN